MDPGEECDLGSLNGRPGVACTKECKKCPVPICGDNHVDPGEECDLGTLNGLPGSACTKECKKCAVTVW